MHLIGFYTEESHLVGFVIRLKHVTNTVNPDECVHLKLTIPVSNYTTNQTVSVCYFKCNVGPTLSQIYQTYIYIYTSNSFLINSITC